MPFSGYYYKINDYKAKITLIVVAGYHTYRKKKDGYVQMICCDESGEILVNLTRRFNSLLKNKQEFWLSKNIFTHNLLIINHEDTQVELNFSVKKTFPKRAFSKNVMGVLGYVPFVECKHFVHAIEACVNGKVFINKLEYNFENASGYIERTYGFQFPQSYFWSHFNQFKGHPGTHLLFSMANPKWLFLRKRVHIGYFIHNNQFYALGSNQEFKLTRTTKTLNTTDLTFENRRHKIHTHFNFGERHVQLLGPTESGLKRKVKEYTNAKVTILFEDKNQLISKRLTGYFGTIESENTDCLFNPD